MADRSNDADRTTDDAAILRTALQATEQGLYEALDQDFDSEEGLAILHRRMARRKKSAAAHSAVSAARQPASADAVFAQQAAGANAGGGPANSGQLYRHHSLTLESDEAAVDDVIREYGNPELAETRLVSRPESSDVARRLATSVLKLWQLNDCTEDTQQLVGELVANAVRHTGARTFGFRMLRRQGWIRIEVRDPSRGLPCLLPTQPLGESGWGLFLVDCISDRWGVDLLPRGKTVWAELRVSEE